MKYGALYLMETIKCLKDQGDCPKDLLTYLLKEVEKEQRRLIRGIIDTNQIVNGMFKV
jgi:hypothetical protein